jgi:hypothetical protein
LFLLTALLHVVDRPVAPVHRRGWTALAVGVGVYAGAVALGDLGSFNVSSLGPSWSTGLETAREHCSDGTSPELADAEKQYPRETRPGEVLVAVPPDVGPIIRFYVAVPCARALAGRSSAGAGD